MFSRQYHRIFSMNNVEEPSGPSQNPNQTIMLRHDPSPGHVRSSYRCSFCERGFSNAQALGGHMNIHRKDRAKLIDDQENSSMEINKVTDDNGTIVIEDSPQAKKVVITSPKDCRADDRDEDDDDHTGNKVQISELGVVRSSINSSKCELDLELRLGLEPRDSSKTKK